jgi:Cu/Ag efflux pump CusA
LILKRTLKEFLYYAQSTYAPAFAAALLVACAGCAKHAAEEVEQQVTVPIERALNGVPSVIARRSRTIFGLSVVELTFAYGTDDYFARAVVLEKLIDNFI